MTAKKLTPIERLTGVSTNAIKRFAKKICPSVFGSPTEELYRQIYMEGHSKNIDDKELTRIFKRGEASRELLIGDEYNKNCFRRLQSLLPDYIAKSLPADRRIEARAIVINALESVKEMLLLNVFYGDEAGEIIRDNDKQKIQGTKS